MTAQTIFDEYRAGQQFKRSLGQRGLYEQARMNERFYVGDQWHGVPAPAERPLVRHNIIKRIGDYKMAMLTSASITMLFSAEGLPAPLHVKENLFGLRRQLAAGGATRALSGDEETALVMDALTDYYRSTAVRVGFDALSERALRGAFLSGTGVLYTYWDETAQTGLYADAGHTMPIQGDIQCEVLDIENVTFGDPQCTELQDQPFVILSQHKSVDEVRTLAKRYGARAMLLDAIQPDRDSLLPVADPGQAKTTLLTKLYKKDGRVFAVQVCRAGTVRAPWDTGVRLYPLAAFCWERRRACAYGDSEVTYLIPNQIAINRLITASVWAGMATGLPLMLVNGDVLPDRITNDPGQILKVYGGAEDVARAVQYISPPAFAGQLESSVQGLIANTLSQSGANDAALGNMRPDNASAIVALREAATLPMQPLQNRYYAFCADMARIWGEFWVTKYGKRALRIEDEWGTWFLPFNGERYRELLLSVKIEVGAASLWNEAQSIATLDHLFSMGAITLPQYLSRLPKGVIPDAAGLLREITDNAVGMVDKSSSATTAGAPMADGLTAMPTVLLGAAPDHVDSVTAQTA